MYVFAFGLFAYLYAFVALTSVQFCDDIQANIVDTFDCESSLREIQSSTVGNNGNEWEQYVQEFLLYQSKF